MTVQMSCANIILHVFRFVCHRVVHVTVQDFMKLKDVILRDWNYIKTFKDQTQHIAVSGDFLFVTIFWRRFFFNQLSYARIGCNNWVYNFVFFLTMLSL